MPRRRIPRQASESDVEGPGEIPAQTPSTSTSSASRQARPTVGECRVCSAPAYCFHYGVLSCRACAAFYRRSVLLGRKYSCRAERDCVISISLKDAGILCRLCRLNKCVRLGMQDEKIQPIASRSPKSVGKETIIDDMEEESVVESSPSISETSANSVTSESSGRRVYDYSLLFDRVLARTHKPPQQLQPDLPLLKQIVAGVHYIRRNQTKKPVIMLEMDQEQTKRSLEWNSFSAADWLMHIPEFADLDMKEKYLIIKYTMFSVGRLERFHATAVIYGREMIESGNALYMMEDRVTRCFNRTRVDTSFFSDHDYDRVHKYFRPNQIRQIDEIGVPILEMEVTETELAFMLCQAAFHLEGREGVSQYLLKLSQKLRERAANELHEYYINEGQQPDYASRLQRLLRIVTDCEVISMERKSIIELTSIFDECNIRDADPPVISSSTSLLLQNKESAA